ncbi:MAG: DinB family protein [Anaerolineales bacterium]
MNDILEVARTILQTTPHRWENLTQSTPATLMNLPPAPDEWSAVDCLQHLVDTDRSVFPVRIQALLAGQDFPAFDPDSQGSISHAQRSQQELVEEFTSLRAANLELFDRLRQSDLTRQARHAELGLVTMSELLHEWAAHDLMHTVQAERALMQPFIQGCQPWRSYFVDHIVEA